MKEKWQTKIWIMQWKYEMKRKWSISKPIKAVWKRNLNENVKCLLIKWKKMKIWKWRREKQKKEIEEEIIWHYEKWQWNKQWKYQ